MSASQREKASVDAVLMAFSPAMREHARGRVRGDFDAFQRRNATPARGANGVAMGFSRGKMAFARRSKSNISQ